MTDVHFRLCPVVDFAHYKTNESLSVKTLFTPDGEARQFVLEGPDSDHWSHRVGPENGNLLRI